jgi:hypothetical protein
MIALFLTLAWQPAIDDLVNEALKNQSAVYSNLTEYTYDFRHTIRQFDAKGKLKGESITSGEAYQSARQTVFVDITRNGKVLSRGAVEKEHRRAAQLMQRDYEARRREQKPTSQPSSSVDGVRMETYATLRHCPLTNLRHETLNGRAAFAIDFGPAPPGLKFPYSHLTRSRGTVWIDAEDRIVSAWKAWVVDGPLYFEERHQRLEPGVWSPSYQRYDLSQTPAGVGWGRRDSLLELTNPKRFSVEVNQKIAEPN